MTSLEAHPRATRRRIARFRRYMDEHVLGPDGFICPRSSECRKSRRKGDSFFEGQLSHVGHRYDLSLDGRPLRIVVVGQEYAFNSIVDGRLRWGDRIDSPYLLEVIRPTMRTVRKRL